MYNCSPTLFHLCLLPAHFRGLEGAPRSLDPARTGMVNWGEHNAVGILHSPGHNSIPLQILAVTVQGVLLF